MLDAAGMILSEKSYVVKPEDCTLSEEAQIYYKISMATVIKIGCTMEFIMSRLQAMLQKIPTNDGLVVAHNMTTVDSAISNNFKSQSSLWENLPKCSTDSAGLLSFVDKYAGPPTKKELLELHELLCETSSEETQILRTASLHDTLASAKLTAQVFCWYKRNVERRYLPCWSRPGKRLTRPSSHRIGGIPKRTRPWDKPFGESWPVAKLEFSPGSAEEPDDSVMYVTVDVETHDWKDCSRRTQENYIGRIVEIAWVLYDVRGNVVEEKCHLVRPEGYVIAEKATQIHGITTEVALKQGCPANAVFANFIAVLKKVPKEGFAIAHNMAHEDMCFTHNLTGEALEVWTAVPKACTLSPRLLGEIYPRYRGRTYGLKLAELYHLVCRSAGPPAKKAKGDAHTALTDAHMVGTIFFYFRKTLEQQALVEVRKKLSFL